MPRLIFADTVYWQALYDEQDQHRPTAIQMRRRYLGPGVKVYTSELVLNEVLNALSENEYCRAIAAEKIRGLRNDPNVTIIKLDDTRFTFQGALDYYAERPDKGWSHTDCMSFIIMTHFHIREALTTDDHYKQNNFKALMRPD